MQRRKAGHSSSLQKHQQLGVNKLLFQKVRCFWSQRARVKAASKDLELRAKEGKSHSPKDIRHTVSMEKTKSAINPSWTGQTHTIICPAVPREARSASWKEKRKPCQFTDYLLMLFIYVSAKDTASREPEWNRSTVRCKQWGWSSRGFSLYSYFFFQLSTKGKEVGDTSWKLAFVCTNGSSRRTWVLWALKHCSSHYWADVRSTL